MRLVVTKGPQPGLIFELQEGPNVAGRDPNNSVHLPSAHVSRAHCEFDRRGSQVVVRDLDSRNGVFIEGQATRETVLRPGMRVQVGDWLLRFEAQTSPAPPPHTPSAGGFGGEATGPLVQNPSTMEPTGPIADEATGPLGGAVPGQDATVTTNAPDSPFGESAGSSPFGAPSGGGFGGFGEAPAPKPSSAQAPESPTPQNHPSAPVGFGSPPAATGFAPAKGAPRTGGDEELEGQADVDWLARLQRARDAVLRGPWPLRFGGVFVVLVLGLFLAPFGGVMSQILRTSDVAEGLAVDRAKALVLALDKRNMRPLAKGEQLGFDAEFVIVEVGVKAALVTDDRGVVRAPSDKVRSSISNKAYFNRARELGRVYAEKEEGLWHVLKPIRASRVEGGPMDVVGWAYIMYDANEVVDSYISNYARLLVALLVLILLGSGCGWAAYRMACRPIVNLREELELAMRGHVSSVVCEARWGDLDALTHSTNRLLQRWQQGGGESTKISPILTAAMEPLPVPAFITTANGTILAINRAAASWLRKDPGSVVGTAINTLIPDPAFATMLQGVCAAAQQSEGGLGRDRVVLSSYALTTVACTDGTGVIAVTTAGE